MLKSLNLAFALTALAATSFAQDRFGLGRDALPEEISAWDVKIMPDGRGLPEGSGDVWTGEEVFAEKCASCHGDFAEGVGNWPKLAGGQGTLADNDPLKTVGSYWPYLSTVWDYVNRSMPFGDAQSLTPDEVYAITAYIIYSNDLVDDDFTLSHENFLEVAMPNADGFIIDDRPETEYSIWSGEPCMENCKENVEITMRATVLDVTPDEGAEESSDAEADDTASTEEPAAEEAVAEEATAEEAAAAATNETAEADPELIAKGENVFKKCKACHKIGEGAKNGTGPELNNLFGRSFGGLDGFKYSKAMLEAGESGAVWENGNLTEFLANPKGFLPGTKMSFAGLKKDEDIEAVLAYLMTFNE